VSGARKILVALCEPFFGKFLVYMVKLFFKLFFKLIVIFFINISFKF
jgi:hypothetical protein